MLDKTPEIVDQKPEKFFADLLGEIQADQVLDVACGPGGFTGVLKESLKTYRKITGIDLSEEVIKQAKEAYPDGDIEFEIVDAAAMAYPDNFFDLAGCAFSLHHLPDPHQAISEMRRVLKPGGIALIVEMYRDYLTETQQTESMIHHWAAEIDTVLGISHNQTFKREEVLEILQPENWSHIQIYDLADLSFDPKGENITQMVLDTIARVLEKATSITDYDRFQQRAEALRTRVAEVGTHISTRLIVLARK